MTASQRRIFPAVPVPIKASVGHAKWVRNAVQRMDTDYDTIRKACFTLFGGITPVSPEFVDQLELSGLKKAFRSLAKESHPDRSRILGLEPDFLQKKFQHIRAAYELLLPYVQGEKSFPTPPRFQWVPQTPAQPERSSSPKSQPRTPSFVRRTVKPLTPTPGSSQPSVHNSVDNSVSKSGPQDWKYSGLLPKRPLRLGQYLFYTKHITWNDLISALVWQASHRPRLGELALERGWIEAHHLNYIHKRKYPQELWGEAAVRLHVLNNQQRLLLIGVQRLCGYPLGRFFHSLGRIHETALALHVAALQRHNLLYRGG